MRTSLLGMWALSTLIWAGCGIDVAVFGPAGEGGTGGSGGQVIPDASADKIDLLLTIDNSRSMSDKQEILAQAVPALLDAFINPPCVNDGGMAVSDQPASADDACPPDSRRLFEPITDMHVGVITTSLGGHGADACSAVSEPSENDAAHLITRGPDGPVSTYDGKGFLAWDPKQALDPPGTAAADNLNERLSRLVVGAGQVGCGYEATLESWYRFLVDPDPYRRIEVENVSANLVGTDDVVLEQRADFLRPDSVVAIIMLSDENDCSIRDGSQYYFAAQIFAPGSSQLYQLPRPRAACATDPNDPCCRSCGQPPGSGCSDAEDDCSEPLSVLEDNINVRCFHQKRRFGIDFLQPIDRYLAGLSEPMVADRHGNVVGNPLFSSERDERKIFLTALVGVPWQDIARRRANGAPDLDIGRNADGMAIGGYQTPGEMVDNGTWDLILGKPASYFTTPSSLPDDPLMIESIDPRSGTHPITMEAVAPPGAAANANSINGHEYSIPDRGDLQYACVFPLQTPRDCADPNQTSCDCDPGNDNPLCQDENGEFSTTQYRAKAYPGIRHLQLVASLGDRGTLGSICPAQLDDPSRISFGYNAAVLTLIESLRPILGAP